MIFKLEVSTQPTTGFETVDLFPNQQLNYDIDFYDSLDVNKVAVPFSTDMRIPLTDTNISVFGYNPFTSAVTAYPKEDYYFKISIYGSSTTILQGMMNILSIEYLSNQPYIEIVLKDFVSKYISDLKETTLAEVYNSYSSSWTSTIYRVNRTMNTFLTNSVVAGGERGVLNQNPLERPIIFPFVDFCNDIHGKFGYAARQFTEYGVGMDRAGIVPVFSVKNFLTAIGDWLTAQGFETRVDSKLFGLNHTAAIENFQPEKLHMVLPCKLEADKDVKTREFHLNQAPFWVGTNENMSGNNDGSSNAKEFVTRWFYHNETFGNYGTHTDGENGLTISNTVDATYGLDVTDAPYPDDGQDGRAGNERGYFAPYMSFNADISYLSGSAFAELSQIQYEIPILKEDDMVYQLKPSDPESTMTFGVFLGIYENGYQVKKIRLEDVNGDPIVLNASNATAQLGNSDKTSHSTSTTHQYFRNEDFNTNEYVVFDTSLTTVQDMLVWEEVPALYLPTDLEIEINSESRYGVNYYLEAIDGDLKADVGTHPALATGQHFIFTQTSSINYTAIDIRKAITRIPDYANLDLKFVANANYNPYFINDETNIKESLENTAKVTPFKVLVDICKRFGCGLFYEYDSSLNKNILRVDPLHLVRTGTENINSMVDDLKSVKVSIGGSRVKNLVIENKDFNLFFDDEDGDDITIGSTTQEINTDGTNDIEIKLDSSIYYKSVCGSSIDNPDNQNLENKIISEAEIGFTKNLFTKHQDVGVRFAYVDKPIYKTRLKRPKVVNFTHVGPNIYTLTQKIYEDWALHTFNGRLFHYNTAGYNLLAEDESGNTTDYYDLISQNEKVKYSENPTIEFDMVVSVDKLSSLDFFVKTLNCSRINAASILVKNVEGEVFEDYAYLTIQGLLQ